MWFQVPGSVQHLVNPNPQENPMKIQVNTGAHIDGHDRLAAHVSETVEQALGHFRDHITRVEVHLSDENGDKSGLHDHRCMLEARLQSRQPVAVTEHAATQDQAVHGAAKKLAHLLDSTFGRVQTARKKGPDTPTLVADLDLP
jgi:ribosome-associated translation inhibitor RaiA